MTMSTEKTDHRIGCFIGILTIAFCFFSGVTNAEAETMKFKVQNVAAKFDPSPVGNAEGLNIGFGVRDGVFTTEGGEVGSFKALVVSDNMGGGNALGYYVLSFADGSVIVGTFQPAKVSPDPEGKFASNLKGSGELVGGTGRFKGIAGSSTFTSKFLKPVKGDLQGKGIGDYVLTYNLPPK
jgi:hypothetical protein